MKQIFFILFTFSSFFCAAQSSGNEKAKTDTAGDAADLDSFLKELQAMMDTMPASAFASFSTTPDIEFANQITKLIDAAGNNYSGMFSKSSLRKEAFDSIYTTTYKLSDADNNEIRREVGGYYTFVASWNKNSDINDAAKIYEDLLAKLKASFQNDYTIEETSGKYLTQLTPKKNAKGRDISLTIKPQSGKQIVYLKIRRNTHY